MTGNRKDILIAATAEVHDDNLVRPHIFGDLANASERVRWFERRNNTFKSRAELEGFKRLIVCTCQIFGTS